LRDLGGGPLPTPLQQPGLRGELLGLLRWVWGMTIEADWPRRERVLRADVVSRTARLAAHGWADVIGGPGKGRPWRGAGQLQVNGYDLPESDLSQATDLAFVPVHATGSWVTWVEPTRYALVYTVTGALVEPGSASPATSSPCSWPHARSADSSSCSSRPH
jgi:hypothetical protein